jgi:hypothetical protein
MHRLTLSYLLAALPVVAFALASCDQPDRSHTANAADLATINPASHGQPPTIMVAGKPRAFAGLKPSAHPLAAKPPTVPTPAAPDAALNVTAPVLDQGQLQCCCPTAAVQCLRTLELLTRQEPAHQHSVVDLYYRINNGVDDGAQTDDAVAQLTTAGVCTTSYAAMWGIADPAHTPGWDTDRPRNQLATATPCTDLPSIRSAIAAGHPVLVGIDVTRAFNPDRTGVIGPKSGKVEGGHALYVVATRTTAAGQQYRVVNSWGADWGDHGQAWLDSSWIQPEKYTAFSFDTLAPTAEQPPPVPSPSCPCKDGKCPVPQSPTPRRLFRR